MPRKNTFILLSLITVVCLAFSAPASAVSLSKKLSGRILLQVEDKGKAWYVEPASQQRAYLGRPADAFRIMRELSTGISDENLDRLRSDKQFACKHAGKIFLQVQARGEAWYVHPPDCSAHYLGRPADAFSIMRNLGLGISNTDIEHIGVNEQYTDPEQPTAPGHEKESVNMTEKQTVPQKKSKEEVKKIAPIEIKKVEPIKLDIKVKSPSQLYIPPVQSPELHADPLLPYYDSLSPF